MSQVRTHTMDGGGDRMSLSRRRFLGEAAMGFGGLAFAAQTATKASSASIDAPKARARSVIFLYMDGGVSHLDSFDPKPRLEREHGQPFKMPIQPTQFNNNGSTLKSPWKFHHHGQSGIPISDLFPHVARHADDLAIVRSMVADFSEHTNANYFLHTGHGLQGRPSMGAWVTYGLGSENRDLPGFVVVNSGLIPPGGLDNFTSGFLPANYQASVFRPAGEPIANITPAEASRSLQRAKLDLVGALDRAHWGGQATDPVESAIANQEMAFRMQMAIPELMEIGPETAATRKLYGLDADNAHTRAFGQACLIARRLVERGVRFIELTCPKIATDRWDAHSGLVFNHESNARAVDQPIAALLTDLKSRGLFEETLIVWGGEFGRTPFAQGSDGRDHNPFGFSIWLAGAGIKGGTIHGATDEYGYHAVVGRQNIHDLHATILYLLGVDHRRLTFRFSGRDIRLTDVAGEIITPILS